MAVRELIWVFCDRRTDFYVSHNQSFKVLGDDGGDCNRVGVVKGYGSEEFFLHWHNKGGLEAGRHNCLSQGQVKNVCEDNQLHSTSFPHMSTYTSCFLCIYPGQSRVNVQGRKTEWQMEVVP